MPRWIVLVAMLAILASCGAQQTSGNPEPTHRSVAPSARAVATATPDSRATTELGIETWGNDRWSMEYPADWTLDEMARDDGLLTLLPPSGPGEIIFAEYEVPEPPDAVTATYIQMLGETVGSHLFLSPYSMSIAPRAHQGSVVFIASGEGTDEEGAKAFVVHAVAPDTYFYAAFVSQDVADPHLDAAKGILQSVQPER
jgi:hypothetical protein